MKLYHTTALENKDSVLENGLVPQVTDAISGSDDNDRIFETGIFGFADIKDAVEFGKDNFAGEMAIFEFEADEVIEDPEYDGGVAYFYPATDAVDAELVRIIQ